MTYMERSGRMSDIWDDIDNEQPSEGGKLREQLEAALKRAKTAEQKLATFEARESASVIGDFLKGKGFKPSAAKWAVKDGVKPDDTDALEQWVRDNSDDLPRLPESEAEEPNEPAAEEQPAPEEPQGDPAATGYADVITQLRSQASPALVSKFETARREVPENATADQVMDVFKRLGI